MFKNIDNNKNPYNKKDVIMQKQMLKLNFFLIVLQDNQVDDLDVPVGMQEVHLIVLQ
jgi:hypothetical protein